MTAHTHLSAGPVGQILDALRAKDLLVKPAGPDKWVAQCPSHNDRHPSLSIGTGSDGRVLLHCQAGCATRDVLAALGLKLADLFPPGDGTRRHARHPRPSKARPTYATPEAAAKRIAERVGGTLAGTWLYPARNGVEVFRILRFNLPASDDGAKPAKTFRPLRPVDRGWVEGDPPSPLPLYALPSLDGAPRVFLPEGEACADAVRDVGLVATTSAHGANGAGKADWTPLAGREVVLLPDHDAGGNGYAIDVTKRLLALDPPTVVKRVDLPGLSDGEDIIEYFNRMDAQTPEELRQHLNRLADDAPIYEPPTELHTDDPPSLESGLIDTLAGTILIGTNFAKDAGGRLYVYEGGVYRPRGQQAVEKAVKHHLKAWGRSKQWSSRRSEEVGKYLCIDAPELDTEPPTTTINTLNGLVDVETGQLRDHDPSHLSPIQLPVLYDPDAEPVAWEKYIIPAFPDDAPELIWQLAAWMMLPTLAIKNDLQKAILFVGDGSNGKSTVLAALRAYIGAKNTASVPLHRLASDRFSAARLVGRLANICPDLPSRHLADTSVFKAIVGGDTIHAERKYAQPFDFTPYSKLIFSANKPPRSSDSSHAFFRRWIVVPFTKTFEGEGAIPRTTLDALLSRPQELAGVLNRALKAARELRDKGLVESQTMRDAWQEFRQTTDPLAVWIDQHTTRDPTSLVPKEELRNAYNETAEHDHRDPMTATAFSKALKRLYPDLNDAQRTVNGTPKTHVWVGIGLRRQGS